MPGPGRKENGYQNAKDNGLATYTGTPCYDCGSTERVTSTGGCHTCRENLKGTGHITTREMRVQALMESVWYGGDNAYPDVYPYNKTSLPRGYVTFLRSVDTTVW